LCWTRKEQLKAGEEEKLHEESKSSQLKPDLQSFLRPDPQLIITKLPSFLGAKNLSSEGDFLKNNPFIQ